MRRTAVLTGASRGIGAGVARTLAGRGFDLVLIARESSHARGTLASVRAAAPEQADVTFVACDLSSMAEVAAVGARLRDAAPPTLLLHCAAVVPEAVEVTADGFERQWAVNHLAPFLLARWVQPLGGEGDPGRVVTVASQLHRGRSLVRGPEQFAPSASYDREERYGQTKLANVLFARALGRRCDPASVLSVSLHPGAAGTGLLYDLQGTGSFDRWLNRAIRAVKRVEPWGLRECVDRVGELCTRSLGPEHQGSYWENGLACAPSDAALDDDLGEWLWSASDTALSRWLP